MDKKILNLDQYKRLLDQKKVVDEIELKLKEARAELKALCPHVNVDGSSMFPESDRCNPFPDCRMCGTSSYPVV